ncbi:axi 1 [Micractinium conductrix]|uniref:Axi 1 n=1 Tax=Micractinium conductrix TaxID=554055 RepID=A0A2P6V8V5_9CHLO|nr:axi 1 [Micractinium conductrix]|eukprot:PSC70520.1 axi 1 [Micractinium conductrix]
MTPAWQHYDSVGRAEGRVASPLRLRLRYTTAGGLTNQLLAHLPTFVIARELGAEVVVPPAVSRPGFFRGNKEWRWESAETLLDLDKMKAYWAPRGLVVHKTPELTVAQSEEYPRLIQRNDPPTALYGNGSCLMMKMPTPGNDLGTIVQRTRQAALAAAEEQLRSSGATPECINLDSGNSFLRVAVFSTQSLALSTLQGFFFNATLVSLAEEIKQALGESFNGVHLRLEDDAAGWNERFGGAAGVVQAYVRAVQAVGFTNASTVYAASGLLFNGTSPEFERIITSLQAAGVARQIVYKEALVGPERLQGLHSEQLALLDVLVLTGSGAFVGHPQSTISVMAEQLRICAGFPPQTNQFLDIPLSEGNQQRFERFVRLAADYMPTGIARR